MRIQSFNSAISSVAKSARNTVAAAMVAASPMVAKAAPEPIPMAKTNTVVMTSYRNTMLGGSPTDIIPKFYGTENTFKLVNCPTNGLPRGSKMTEFKSTSPQAWTLETVADGWVPAAEVQAKDKLTGTWSTYDILTNVAKAGDPNYIPPEGASKFSVQIPKEDAESKFFRVIIPGIDEEGKLQNNFKPSDHKPIVLEFVAPVQ